MRAGLGAGFLFLPLPYAWVWAQQPDGGMKLRRLPKMALVVGNSKYKEAPLKNPANGAKAIAEVLKSSGFEVTLKMRENNRARRQFRVLRDRRQGQRNECAGRQAGADLQALDGAGQSPAAGRVARGY